MEKDQEIIHRYFFDKLSPDEKERLMDKMSSDEALKREFVALQNRLSLAKMYPESGDDEYAKQGLMQLKKKAARRKIHRVALRYAGYAAAVLLFVFSFKFLFYDSSETQEGDHYIEYSSFEGKREKITLADGTEVTLAPSSVIRVPDNFNRNKREIMLDGEILLTVTRNNEKPFIVQTSKGNVEVLGTTFSVSAYERDTLFNTYLLSGSVKVYNSDESLVLSPNEGATYLNQRLVKSGIDRKRIHFMQSGIYDFEEKSLYELLDILKIWYNVEFIVENKQTANVPLTGKVREGDDIEEILIALQQIHPFKYQIQNSNTIVIN